MIHIKKLLHLLKPTNVEYTVEVRNATKYSIADKIKFVDSPQILQKFWEQLFYRTPPVVGFKWRH